MRFYGREVIRVYQVELFTFSLSHLFTFSPSHLYIMYVRVCVRGLNLFESIESVFR